MNKLKKSKKALIIALVLIPIVLGSLLYVKNGKVKNATNLIIGRTIDFVKGKLRTGSTNAEKEEKKISLSDYYLSLKNSEAADKLYIVKMNDKGLFNDLIRLMNRKSADKTSEVLKLIRNIELKKDFLSSTYDEIQEEKQIEIKREIETLESMDTLAGIRKVERMANEYGDYMEIFPYVIDRMEDEKASELLFYMDNNIKKEIMSELEIKKRNNLERIILQKEIKYDKLKNLARSYDSKPTDEVIKEIGNKEVYSIEELSYIYMNLSVEKAAEILSRIKEDELVEEIFVYLEREEELRKSNDSKTAEINEAVKFLREYNSKIDELVEVYERMSASNVAKITEKMLENTEKVTSLEIDSMPIYEISDSTIVVDVLRKMKKTSLSKIINNMNTKKASQLTQMLASP
ncbi:hypothetical protein FYJ27_09275 [Anaerosalibacter bizertensis]|uniref:Uncharacterized protein n=1 Tax=Anaerosalibacter bizertensis TaxID=932217 RepID=A0A844FJ62_9FIRM|nr:hypothetical protein [Anaerosalibacter bizertensis]MBV1816551.1 hypothetical protein [Bacteroidales bacterium MSK.15.36]HHV27235.1 hypothetical protein [Tissierellia bacterium]MBU5293297.1 hypothetical protein [Anaerosalibacter bizertensis]MCB5558645.1 hypothetical protein [Anaerosalibacter bizertensis]MCG4563938.1 hypothetical protein [Anaerosalibacter bizertensis]